MSSSIITASAGIALSGLCGLICLIVAYSFDPAFSASDVLVLVAIFAVGMILFLVVSVLIMVYFFKSARVRTYMGSDAYITQGPWKFVKPPRPAVPDPPRA